jgi:hypothetical protein
MIQLSVDCGRDDGIRPWFYRLPTYDPVNEGYELNSPKGHYSTSEIGENVIQFS